VRIARLMAMLLALITVGVSLYYGQKMPYAFLHLVPANVGACGSLLFWIKAPSKKKARWRAALASLLVVPLMAATVGLGIATSPIEDWQVFSALTALALMIAIYALMRVKRKSNHPWAGYYREVA
jgi:peptidoglycan/LPS O-acetylase OafA/YrhL